MEFYKKFVFITSPPSAPNPQSIIGAQGASNEATARLNAQLNRMDTYTPFGSVTYTDMGDDRTRVDQTFSPTTQALYDQQMDIGGDMLGLAEGAISNFPNRSFFFRRCASVSNRNRLFGVASNSRSRRFCRSKSSSFRCSF